MSGQFDDEVGGAEESSAPDSALDKTADQPVPPPRAFRSWASAQSDEDRPSALARMRHGLASLFSRAPVTPPKDFRFPWTRPDGPVSDEASAIDAAFSSVDEALPYDALVPVVFDVAPELDIMDAEPGAPELEVATDEFEVLTAPVDGDATEEIIEKRPKRSLMEWLFAWRKKAEAAPAIAAQTVIAGNPVFLFSKFRAFYNEIIRFKHQKTEYAAGFSTALMTEAGAGGNPDAAAEAQSKKLVELLELQAAEAKWMGGEMSARYPDAQYAMAALADETFMNIEWEGQSSWEQHLIEFTLHRTRGAEYELFNRIDKLLKDAPNSPVARDLARVYLLVLAAGFRGKYRRFGLSRALAEYRQRLYEFIHKGDPLLLYAPDRRIFPDAASRTLEGHAVSRFSAAQRWAAILVLVAASYAIIAHLAWNRVSADLKDVTGRIVAIDSMGAR